MKQIIVSFAVLAAGSTQAWECEHERNFEKSLDLSGSESLTVAAGAGDLEITGDSGLNEARIQARVCASEETWAEEAEVLTGSGRNAEIAVLFPDTDDARSIMGSHYVYMDLRIQVPDDIALEIHDSSGDMTVAGTASLSIRDSSGDIDIEYVHGNVFLEDSSGDIDLMDIAGDVTVEQDSSGDIYGRDIVGSVRVERDSSGDIRFRDVGRDFIVERDSSGDIEAETVGGDFLVRRDGSGEITMSGISGAVEIPEEG